MNSEIWVLAEQNGREVAHVTLEILGEARKLADQSGDKVAALLLGYRVSPFADILAHYGADEIYLVDHERLKTHTNDDFVALIYQLINKHEPSVFLCGATPLGSDLAPRLAARLRTGLVTNCVIIRINRKGLLEMTGPAYGENFYITKICPVARPQMATVLPKVIGTGKPDISRKAKVNFENPQWPVVPARTRSLGVIKGNPRTVDVTDADIVVAGGRGVKDAKQFDLIWQLADHLAASVAGSRPAVDAGWITKERQIGQTGKTVAPSLFISCGISGAMQHTMGMKDSKRIIAINNNPTAAIFKIASVAILADLHKFLPLIIERLRKDRASSSNDSNH
jgi:electron transfer flavoprotein alpha subunit